MLDENNKTREQLANSLSDFLDNSLCGYITTDATGVILYANKRLSGWLQVPENEIQGRRFSDLLSTGGRIYYETHLAPLLRMQGFYDEVALELKDRLGIKIPVFINAYERLDDKGNPIFIRITIFRASDRRKFEQNLQTEKKLLASEISDQRDIVKLRDELIAILGHDLRNPLGSIHACTQLLLKSEQSDSNRHLIGIVQKSVFRMSELIKNMMDFARTRLGGGIIPELSDVTLQPVLQQVIDELQTQFPGRKIITEFDINGTVLCDGNRIAQLFSNLLANAITHGDANMPVYVLAFYQKPHFELAIINHGEPIPANLMDRIFEPFAREANKPSHSGLGLGLYIASLISRAHGGTLTCTSDKTETRFIFKMNTP